MNPENCPLIFILILSYNGKYLLDDSISSYFSNDYPNFEVVVIDNGSTDKTKEWVNQNYPEVFVLRTKKNLGYSGGFNLGLDYAFNQNKADYVLITNNDVKADSKVISELVKVAETDPMIGFVTGKVYYYDEPDLIQTVGYYEDELRWIGGHLGHKQKDTGQFDKIEERSFSDDIFMLVTKELYDNTNGYDTNFQFQAEQFDWQIRAKKMGYRIFYTPNAKIWHKDSITIGKASPFKIYYDVRNSFVVRLKHRGKNYLNPYFKWYFKNMVVIPFIKYLAKGKIKMSASIFNGFFSALIWGLKNKKLPFK